MKRLAYAAFIGTFAALPLALAGQVQAAAPQTHAASHATTDATANGAQRTRPDITTRHEKNRTVQEYRINGKLYAIKVTPSVGPSYYLLDSNGDGNFQRTDDTNRIVPPHWTLFRW